MSLAALAAFAALQAHAAGTYEHRTPLRGLAVQTQAPAPAPVPAPAPAPTPAPAPKLELSSAALDFEAVELGSSKDLSVLLSNTGNATLSLSSVLSGSQAFQFPADGATNCGVSLAAGASCATTVRFTPTELAAQSGALTVTSNAAGSPHTVQLSGTGRAALLALEAATSANFGTPKVGQSASLSFTVRNDGNQAATGLYAAVTAGQNIAITASSCGTQPSPVSLAAGQNCSFTLTWSPTTAGALGAVTASVQGSFSSSPLTQSLSGTAQPLDIVLNVAGYRTFSDGSLATSCNGYRGATGNTAYSGSTGDGVYRIDPDGAGAQPATNVLCDMTRDGGGWTLVMRGTPTGLANSQWNTTTAQGTTNALVLDGDAFKFGDDFIQALPTKTAYRVDGYTNADGAMPTGMTNPYYRYVKGNCVYNHTTKPAAGSLCAVTYPSLSDSLAGTNASPSNLGPCAWHKGIADANNNCAGSGGAGYIITNHYQGTTDYNLYVLGNGGSVGGNANTSASYLKARFRLWVK